MRPKLSVIVPCYNCRNTVERTLDSLAAQTLKDLAAALHCSVEDLMEC